MNFASYYCLLVSSDSLTLASTSRMIDQGSPLMGSSAHLMPTGTAQRIDGSEQEKQAVRKVLEKMDEYIIHEVMSKSVYEPFRSRWCVHVHEMKILARCLVAVH